MRRFDEEFDVFFEAEFRPLRRLAYLLTGDWSEAEDLAQETMTRTYRAWRRIRDRERPGAYARTVLINRHRSLRSRARVAGRARRPMRNVPAEPTDMAMSLSLWLEIRRLPDGQRAALVLRYYEDMSERDTAEILGVPVGTVKTWTHRGLARLRERFADEIALGREQS